MRKPSEYISAAAAGVRSRLMPDCSASLRHGGSVATVTRVGSRIRGPDALTEEGVPEDARVLALASDFPCLARGCLVSLDGASRIVTSARTDPAGASLHVGLSAPLDDVTATYRRPGTAIRQPLRVLATEGEVLDTIGDDIAPTACRAWFVALSKEHWLEVTDPQIGDELAVDGGVLRVAAVSKRDGYWLLTCRARR